MKRLTPLVLLLLLGPSPASAQFVRGKTYCVGGFEFLFGITTTPTREECAPHARPWHFHSYVRGPDGKCRECWDENDDTCNSVFIGVDHPDFHVVERWECARAGALPPGREVLRPPSEAPPPPLPPAPPVDVKAEITRVSPGPYAAGDTVRIDARAQGSDGQGRAVHGGEIIVRGADGGEVMRVPVKDNADGSVFAGVAIPSGGGNLKLEFHPGSVVVGANEKLGAVSSADVSITVSPCRLRGVALQPSGGEVIVAGAPIALRGEVRTAAGAKAPASAISPGTSAVFVIDLAGGGSREVPASIDASGSAIGSVTLDPPATDSVAVSVRLLGKGGTGDFCPGAASQAELTRLGVGLEIAEPAEDAVCYVGRPCKLVARFRLPASGASRGPAEAFVRASDLQVTATLQGAPLGAVPAAAGAGDPPSRSMVFSPRHPGAVELEVEAASGGRGIKATRRFAVREPLLLRLPEEVDLGAVKAGAARAETCRPLDFSASRGVEEQPLELEYEAPAGCRATLGLVDDHGRFFPLESTRRFTIDPLKLTMPLCLEVPRCAGEQPAPARLSIRAAIPDFPSERATVKVRWRVTGRSFLACHYWWIALIAGGLLVLFVIYGFVSPERFGADDVVKIAGKPEGLSRTNGRRLVELPGGRAGFYRSAAVGLRSDGNATSSRRGVAVTLSASRGDVVLRGAGLRRINPQTRKLEDVPAGKEGHIASRNVVYSTGALYFQVK